MRHLLRVGPRTTNIRDVYETFKNTHANPNMAARGVDAWSRGPTRWLLPVAVTLEVNDKVGATLETSENSKLMLAYPFLLSEHSLPRLRGAGCGQNRAQRALDSQVFRRAVCNIP